MLLPEDTLIADARAFLSDLAENNTRAWFQSNKQRYETQLRQPALALLNRIAAEWGREIGTSLSPKLFRANRDVRFSKDKTPYHTHLHMLWAESNGPAWFLGVSPTYVSAGGGFMGFDKARLDNWRTTVAGPEGEALNRALAEFAGRIDPPELKRIPAPYDKDHPQGELLRRKSFVLWKDIEAESALHGVERAALDAFGSIRAPVDRLRGLL